MPTAVQNVTNTVVNYFNRPQASPDKDFGLTTLRGILTTGAGAIFICASFAETAHGFWHVSGLSLIVALAALICGGFLGFLFGIPRSLDKNEAGATRSFGTNTNLEQISDWLTKIIVGVSLTQLPAIQRHLDVLTTKIATGFGKYLGPEYAYPYSGALLAFFSICGFLYVYLWCML
ncbi:MAG: hypothetical protein JWQ78_1511, partial [Sediminibacterium sp.]|nr:hypothetical protein [Sediminibacterium sp.]